MPKMKIGLALGSGAARGLAHIGVVKALEENEIHIDVISGVSIGAVVGSLYAAGLSVKKMADFARGFGDRKIAFWLDPSFFRGGGILKGDKIEQALEDLIGPLDFRELKIPFYAVASNIMDGKEVVLSSGRVVRAVRASFAIPGIFSPVEIDGSWLVDGALVAPVPTRILKENGCDLIIAVDVSAEPEKEESIGKEGGPKIFDVLMQSFYIIQDKLVEPCMEIADVSIIPAVGDYDWTEFSRADELIEAGYRATTEIIPAIKKIASRRRKFLFLRRIFKGRDGSKD